MNLNFKNLALRIGRLLNEARRIKIDFLKLRSHPKAVNPESNENGPKPEPPEFP